MTLLPHATRRAAGSLKDPKKAGCGGAAINYDPQSTLQPFANAHHITYPLLSDQDKSVLTAYGAYGEKMNYGKTIMGVIRSTFVVDADGKIEKALYAVKATGHVDRLRKDLGI